MLTHASSASDNIVFKLIIYASSYSLAEPTQNTFLRQCIFCVAMVAMQCIKEWYLFIPWSSIIENLYGKTMTFKMPYRIRGKLSGGGGKLLRFTQFFNQSQKFSLESFAVYST